MVIFIFFLQKKVISAFFKPGPLPKFYLFLDFEAGGAICPTFCVLNAKIEHTLGAQENSYQYPTIGISSPGGD